MVTLRRCGPLLGTMIMVGAILVARLYEVQVQEHDIWAREAVNLMRSWEVMPYQRGDILDAKGRSMVTDERVFELEFVWREFRRGHALGQVAQLRSVVAMEYVPLQEAQVDLADWALGFLSLSPAEIDSFGTGGALSVGSVDIPRLEVEGRRARTAAARYERRRPRASELHFYTKALLGLGRGATRDLERAQRESPELSYLHLAAGVLGLEPEQQAQAVRSQLNSSLSELEGLADRIDWALLTSKLGERANPWDRGSLSERLLALVETKRSEVQFATADALFRRAAGFDPSRLDVANLARVDLDWLRRALYWDGARLNQWREDRGGAWPQAVESHLAGYTIVRSKLDASLAPPGQRVLSALAMAFCADETRTVTGRAAPKPWWQVERIVGLSHLIERCEQPEALDMGQNQAVLPCQDEGVRALDDLGRLRASLPAPRSGQVDRAAEVMMAVAEHSSPTWGPSDEPRFERALLHWDGFLQERIDEMLSSLDGPLRLAPEWVDSALERREYFVRDWGARPILLDPDPSYELVHLVTRDPAAHAGFKVRATTRRKRLAVDDSGNGESIPVAAPLVGRVRSPYLLRLLEQRPRESDLRQLRRKRDLGDHDLSSIQDLVSSTVQAGEVMGGSGLEGYFEEALKGRSGFHVSRGLQDRVVGSTEASFQPAVDGMDLHLTLDLDLQRAAQAVIDAPDPPPESEERPDRVWHNHPVGAIVMLSPRGDVLAAASGPSILGRLPGAQQDGQARFAYDRTLRQHTFQPPGSVFKPFVAAWALDQDWIDPVQTHVSCAPMPGEEGGLHRPGASVHCHSTWGHGDLTLHRALLKSCNAYFAMVGEDYFDGASVRRMARTFGFDEPTGVRSLDRDGQRGVGLLEDARSNGFFQSERPATEPTLQRLGNGLTAISATVMQVARAYVGLATGAMPKVRLVKAMGDVEIPQQSEALPLSAESLETVRHSLRAVPIEGTAAGTGLDPDSLGFSFACKTGSADYQKGKVPDGMGGFEPGMRKHGWVAGWFPAENPVAIVVVYVHDTSTTSSHVATHVARQFLETPAVRGFVEEAR